MLTVCLFAVSLYAQAQTAETKNTTRQPNWIKTYTPMGMGYMDTEGEVVLNAEYDELHPFGVLAPGLAVIVQADKMGLIDLDGTIIVSPRYDVITTAENFNPHWLMVGEGNLYGFIDFDGNEVVPVMYDEFAAPAQSAEGNQNPGTLKLNTNKDAKRL